MSLSDTGLRKQIKSFFTFSKKQYSLEDVERKTQQCEDLFESLHQCVQKHGWNDNHCQVTIKPKYDRCIVKRDKINNLYLEQQDDL